MYKGKIPFQSDFSHHYACWARNHNGWSKMKKLNKRLAKSKIKQETLKTMKKEMSNEED